jgi:hypothetical protein
MQITGRDEAIFTVVVPKVWNRRAIAHEHLPRISEVQAPMLQRGGPLDWIEADIHRIIVSHKLPCKSICVIPKKQGRPFGQLALALLSFLTPESS